MALSKEKYLELKEQFSFNLSEAHRTKLDAERRERYWLSALEGLQDEYGEQDEQGSTELSGGRDGSQSSS